MLPSTTVHALNFVFFRKEQQLLNNCSRTQVKPIPHILVNHIRDRLPLCLSSQILLRKISLEKWDLRRRATSSRGATSAARW